MSQVFKGTWRDLCHTVLKRVGRCWCMTDVEKDSSLRMSETVEKIAQLMSEQRTARTCESIRTII